LAAAKPQNIESNVQSESDTPVPQNSTAAKGKRRERDRRKIRYLEQICQGLGIDYTGNRFADLRAIMAKTSPEVSLTTVGKRGKGEAWARWVRELRNKVGPWENERLVELDVFESVSVWVKSGCGEPPVRQSFGQITFPK